MMSKIVTLSQRGQITIPKEIRDELGFEPFDRIEFIVRDGEAILHKTSRSLGDVAGMFPPPDVPIEDMPRRAKEERAKQMAENSGE